MILWFFKLILIIIKICIDHLKLKRTTTLVKYFSIYYYFYQTNWQFNSGGKLHDVAWVGVEDEEEQIVSVLGQLDGGQFLPQLRIRLVLGGHETVQVLQPAHLPRKWGPVPRVKVAVEENIVNPCLFYPDILYYLERRHFKWQVYLKASGLKLKSLTSLKI